MNAEVRRYLNHIVFDKRLDRASWSENLPIVQRTINSMVKSLTGMTPAYILFGGAIDLEEGLILNTANDIAPEVENTAWGEWLQQRQIATRQATEVIRERLKEHEVAQRQTDTGRRTEYAKGSFVLKEYRPNTMSRKPNKQTFYRTGPYEVLSYVD